MEAIGKVNRYICRDCRTQVYTVNLNTGTTPFGTTCPHCKGHSSLSNFYRIGPLPPQSEVTITHCFYRPTPERLAELNAELQQTLRDRGDPNPTAIGWDEHVLMGGLCFDRLGENTPAFEPVPDVAAAFEPVPDVAADFERFQTFIFNLYGKRAKRR